MALGQREERRSVAGECRQCSAFCDKLVDPAGCMEMGCPFLYSYDDPLSGRRYMGCLNKVFKGEIDVDAFLSAERTGGFGGIKMTGEPLPQCRFRVEQAYEGEGPEFECTNRRFFDCEERGPEAMRVFDLRNVLT